MTKVKHQFRQSLQLLADGSDFGEPDRSKQPIPLWSATQINCGLTVQTPSSGGFRPPYVPPTGSVHPNQRNCPIHSGSRQQPSTTRPKVQSALFQFLLPARHNAPDVG